MFRQDPAMKILITTLLLLATLGGHLAGADKPATAGRAIDGFLKDHCLRCHDATKQKGDLRLDTLGRDFSNHVDAERWAEIMTRINAGEMPPKDEAKPSVNELGAVVDWIAGQIKAGEAARMAKRGPIAHYRLSREEYANTIYDLLGVHYDVLLPGTFSEDPRWHGFERIGSLLSLSPSHVERYFKAAETVLERAFPEQPTKSTVFRADAIEMAHRNERKKLEAMGIAKQVRAVVWPEHKLPALRGYWGGLHIQPGMYRARIQLSGLQPAGGRAPHLAIWHTELKRTIFDEDIIAPEGKPVIVQFETFLSPPVELDIYNAVAGTIEGHTRNVLTMGSNYFISTSDTRYMEPTGYKLTDDAGKPLHPLLLVDWIEWEGPLVSEADQRKRDGLMPTTAGDMNQARASLQLFADRAWRRPALAAELARYVTVLEQELAAGESFRSAMLAAMTGILTSKNFFFIEEGSTTQRRALLNDWELATRLAYFLWGSMPDEALLAAARANTLHQPEQLRAHLKRMLADPKIRRFTEAFPRQWLQLHKVGMFPPDPKLYPDYDVWLEKSMVLETTGFFSEVFARNLSLSEFLHSDWTMLNPRLALHYQVPPLTSSGFQRVALRPEDHRGGLLTQASVLSLTSDGTRHRPVHRGVWVSEAVFGHTPPPPPPNVEPLAPTPANVPKATVRKQLEAHASNANCASCHRKIDPLGFAFDNYDAIGQWRTQEVMTAGQGTNPTVDASGTLPDGRRYDGPEAFKQLLTQDIDRFAEAFVEQLATFAVRRVMTVDDLAQIHAIAQGSAKDKYRLKDVVEQLVLSDLFQKR